MSETTPRPWQFEPAEATEEGLVSWRCFHCDEVFTVYDEARQHFGASCLDDAGCQLSAVEGGILALYRKAQDELDEYRQEDTANYREFYRLGAEHSQALIREEQKGYDKGLKDGQALAAAPPPEDRMMAEAVKALEPFAAEAERYDPDEGDGASVAWNSDFTLASLRRARDALSRVQAATSHAEKPSAP